MKHTNSFVKKCSEGTDGDVSSPGSREKLPVHHQKTAAGLAMTQSQSDHVVRRLPFVNPPPPLVVRGVAERPSNQNTIQALMRSHQSCLCFMIFLTKSCEELVTVGSRGPP